MKSLTTKKLYYKSYDHRLVIKCRVESNDTSLPSSDTIAWIMEQKFPGKYRINSSNHYSWKCQGTKWKHYKVESQKIVFFKDPEAFEALKSTIGEQFFTEYEKPASAAHKQTLEKEKVITRSSLFYGKYRYVVRFKIKVVGGVWTTSHIVDAKKWAEEYFGKDPERIKINTNWNGSFFFANASDAMIFKLSQTEFESMERIVLLSEIEEAGQ